MAIEEIDKKDGSTTYFALKFNNHSDIFKFVFHFKIFNTEDFEIKTKNDGKLILKIKAIAFKDIDISSIIDGCDNKSGVDYLLNKEENKLCLIDDSYFLEIYDYDFRKSYSINLGDDSSEAKNIYDIFKNGFIWH